MFVLKRLWVAHRQFLTTKCMPGRLVSSWLAQLFENSIQTRQSLGSKVVG